jgi:hypothetical protein
MKSSLITLIAALAAPSVPTAMAETARQALGPAAIVPLAQQQPPAKLIVDPPLAEQVAQGRVLIQYRAENLRIVPVFGSNALDVSPRIGRDASEEVAAGRRDTSRPTSSHAA